MSMVSLLMALFVSSVFSLLLLWVRVVHSTYITYNFLAWNLLLAWIPLGVSLLMEHFKVYKKHRLALFLVLAGIWLIFFPNAPYMITDFIHLKAREAIPYWYDFGMLMAFALTGLFIAFTSLFVVQNIVRRYVGAVSSWIFVVAITLLNSFGIYMGRFLRWNSWDIVGNPLQLFHDIISRVTSPVIYTRMSPFIIALSFFFLVTYFFFFQLTSRSKFTKTYS